MHRDLKPSNIKLTPEGEVKVLDFGLAKALVDDNAPAAASASPTRTRDGTESGVILGTAGYMSPEQVKGEKVDPRTDVFAFGAVLYEMLSGKQAFPGGSIPEVLAAVLTRDPDWDAVPSSTPDLVSRLVRNCLKKDRSKRIPHMGVACIENR